MNQTFIETITEQSARRCLDSLDRDYPIRVRVRVRVRRCLDSLDRGYPTRSVRKKGDCTRALGLGLGLGLELGVGAMRKGGRS